LAPLSAAGSGYGNNLAGHPFDNDNLDNTFSIKNAVKYTSLNYYGVQFGGLYGFSNAACQFSNNRAWCVCRADACLQAAAPRGLGAPGRATCFCAVRPVLWTAL
jgi:predicted porin